MDRKRLNIVHLTPFYYPSIGGVENVTKYLAEGLRKREHNVEVYTSKRNHKGVQSINFSSYDIINSIPIYRFKSIFNLGHMSYCPRIYKMLYKNNFDIIHTHVYRHPHMWMALRAKNKNNASVILHGHNPFFDLSQLKIKKKIFYSIFDFYAKNKLLTHIDWVIALTEFEKNKFIELGIDQNKISIIPNAASDECFQTIEFDSFISKYSLYDKRLILFVGNMNSAKRPELLILALAEIIKIIPNAFLLLVGPDEGSMFLVKQWAEKLKLNNSYLWLGPLYGNEKLQAFSASEIFALSSDLDSLPLVVVEAMAFGKPVVATDAIGPSAIIRDNYDGFLVKRGNFHDLANRIIKLLSNKELYTRISNNARKTSIDNYNVSNIINKVEEIYYNILFTKYKQRL